MTASLLRTTAFLKNLFAATKETALASDSTLNKPPLQKAVFNSVTQRVDVGGSPFFLLSLNAFSSKIVLPLISPVKIASLERGVALMKHQPAQLL